MKVIYALYRNVEIQKNRRKKWKITTELIKIKQFLLAFFCVFCFLLQDFSDPLICKYLFYQECFFHTSPNHLFIVPKNTAWKVLS